MEPKRSNFPRVRPAFIGRAREMAELETLLTSARLVTLVGTGGCGKTRLALESLLRIQARYPDGVWFIDLAPLNDPALIPPTIAAALELRDRAELSTLDALRNALAGKQLVLVFDNCEHLSGACAGLIKALVDTCRHVTVLATSRQALDLPAEKILILPPLDLQDAVELFVARAESAGLPRDQMNQALIAEICERLDRLPLALELAAARVKMLAPAQILARLGERFRLLKNQDPAAPPRQATLRTLLDWSYDLLDPGEQVLLRRLGVFAASFDLEAVEAIAMNGAWKGHEELPYLLDGLTGLAEKSLIAVEFDPTRTRYRLLDTIREYARARLDMAGESEGARTRHLGYYTQLAEQIEPDLLYGTTMDQDRRLGLEQDNCRAAMEFALHGPYRAVGLRLVNALWRYWNNHGRFREGLAWLNPFLAEPIAYESPASLAKAYYCAGALYFRLGELSLAEKWAKASLELRRSRNDPGEVALTLNLLGIIASDRGEYARAQELLAETLSTRQRLEDQQEIASTLNNLGVLARRQGDFERAGALYAESLTLRREFGDYGGVSNLLTNLGEIEFLLGRYARAASLLEQSAAIARGIEDDHDLAQALITLGRVRRVLGESETATSLANECLVLSRATGDRRRVALALENLGDLARDAGDNGRAASLYQEALTLQQTAQDAEGVSAARNALGRVLCLQGDWQRAASLHRDALEQYHQANNRLGIAESLEGLAGAVAATGDFARAIEWLAVATTVRQTLGTPVHLFDQPRMDTLTGSARKALSDKDYAEAWRRGTQAKREQTVALVREWHARMGTMEQRMEIVAPPELDLYAFGETRVYRRAQLLTSADWRYAKARELCFYLLTYSPTTKEQIALALWQDAAPDQIRRAFHHALHHLRTALGRGEWIAFRGGEYSFQRAGDYSYDVERFEHALAQTKGRDESLDGERLIPALTTAVETYTGDYLNDVEGGEWIVFRRATLRRQFFEAGLDLGRLLSLQERYQPAAEVFQRLVQHDNMLEQAHRELMRCYARLGDTSRAVRQYQTLEELLRAELGGAPSPESRSLYEQVRLGKAI